MRVLYTSTLCVPSQKSPTWGQILPTLKKLEKYVTVEERLSVRFLVLRQPFG